MIHYFFDLDGTLADTDRDIREAWKAALRDLDLTCPRFEEEFVAGPPIDEMTKRLFPDLYTPELADRIREGFARHYDSDGFPNTTEYPGVLEAVRAIKARGDYAAIVTNKRFVGATLMSRHFGWDRLFDALHAGDMDVAQGLPNARKLRKSEILARVIDALHAPKGSCVMIGDTISDFEAARACGIASIAVPWGYGKDEELRMANYRISSADEISKTRFA